MRSLRHQFVLSHILPFVIILPLAGLLILYLIEAQFVLGEASDNLETRAALIAEAVARQPEILANQEAAQRFIAEIAPLADGDVLGTADAVVGPVEDVLPVDVRIPGCPPAPGAIIEALLALLDG